LSGGIINHKESTMEKIEVHITAQTANETDRAGKGRKSLSLRLDKQIIRTLTGGELRLVGGGTVTTFCVTDLCGLLTHVTK
jgi:hypothetical protein